MKGTGGKLAEMDVESWDEVGTRWENCQAAPVRGYPIKGIGPQQRIPHPTQAQ